VLIYSVPEKISIANAQHVIAPLKQPAAASRETVKGGAAKTINNPRHLHALDGFPAVLFLWLRCNVPYDVIRISYKLIE